MSAYLIAVKAGEPRPMNDGDWPTMNRNVPSTVTRYTGSNAWITSEETSINIDTKPSVQTPAGTLASPLAGLGLVAPFCWICALDLNAARYQAAAQYGTSDHWRATQQPLTQINSTMAMSV